MITLSVIVILTFCCSVFILKLLRFLAYKTNNLETNFRGCTIPIGSGVLIPIGILLFYPIEASQGTFSDWLYYCYITLIFGLIGFIDDRFGSKKIKGIKGHLLYLIKSKKMSTGLAKLVMITITGFGISLAFYDQVLTIMLCTITFAIWTNIINLLDVRPGRAIKGFWILSAIIFSIHFLDITYLGWIIITQSILLFIVDIMEWGMLGDSGSNILGGIIGYWIIVYSSNIELLIYFFTGFALTLYAEKKSFSQWIEKYPMIQRIDHWGRKVPD